MVLFGTGRPYYSMPGIKYKTYSVVLQTLIIFFGYAII